MVMGTVGSRSVEMSALQLLRLLLTKTFELAVFSQARNAAGYEGFVPENYIQLTSSDVIDHNEVNVDADDIPNATTASSAAHAGAGDAGHNYTLYAQSNLFLIFLNLRHFCRHFTC